MLKHTEAKELNSALKGFGCRVLRRRAEVGVSVQKPPVLAAQRTIAALQSAEDSALASAPIEQRLPCPAGKISHDGTCIYPLGEKAQGNWNYIIYNECAPLMGLIAVFEVTQDIEAEYDLNLDCAQNPPGGTLAHLPTGGVVVQFNCYSKDVGKFGQPPGGIVQYIFYVQGQTITPHIQYASGTPDGIDHDWSPFPFFALTLPKNNTLPAGYSLWLFLETDANGYVNDVIFGVEDNYSNVYMMSAWDSDPLFPNWFCYPLRILEFQTNVVSTNSHYVHFKTGGAGTLTYASSQQLYVEGGSYDHCVGSGLRTCESSNASYGFPEKLDSSISNSALSQSVVAK